MRRVSQSFIGVAVLFAIISGSLGSVARAADFKREVIYQIITDRFFDGSTTNNNRPQSAGL